MSLRDILDIYPLSSLQEGMLFHSLYDRNSGVYFNHVVLGLAGDLNLDALKHAWEQVAQRHSVLRTSIEWEEIEKPLQVVHRDVEIEIHYEDLGELTPEQEEEGVQEWLAADLAQPFDLTRAPLMRFAVLRTGKERQQFVWSFHHILLDGWSVPLLLGEVFSFYRAEVEGTDVQVEPSRPYGDYIRWLGEQRREAAEQYWRRALAGFEEATPLPGVRGRALEIGERERTGWRQAQLPAELSRRLQELARREQLTLNTVLQGAWGLLLSRYSRREEVVYGATVSGRPGELRGVERMVGLFINTLPVRVRVREEAEVVAWLRELQEAQVVQREYEYSGLVEVQGWSEIKSGVTLFDSIFVFENYPLETSFVETLNRLKVTNIIATERPNYPLSLVAGPGERVVLRSYYDRGLFADETIERLLQQLQVLLEGIARDPRQRVRELSLVSEQERERLAEWNRTAREFPRESSIAEQFELQVGLRGEAEAVVYGTERLSYRELNERANRLARYLKGQGVGPEVVVGVSQERSLDLIVSLLGVLKAGGAYLPLDPEYPSARREYMAAQAGAKLVLSELPQGLNEYGAENLERQSGGDNLAYVMYTSGSTGRPKGIAVTQANVLRLVHEACYVSLGPGEVVAQASTASFDAATFEIWGALLNGARLVGVSREELLSAVELGAKLRADGVTVLFLTTALFNAMARQAGAALAGVKQVLFGGEQVDVRSVAAMLDAGVAQLKHVYGPTETTTYASWYEVKAVSGTDVTVPIGRPINNTEAYVLDERGQLLPVGVTGELYLGGEGLARGYVGDAAQTAEKFVPHAFGERLYRTGDLVRWRADGELEFVGRVDDQVKLRGYRIEPGEIEQALREHEAVQDAVVVVRGDEDEEKRLVAYIAADAAMVSVSELRAHLLERLPEYMAPWSFEYLERLPLNANGKVDHDALPEPASVASSIEGYVGPRTATEEMLCGIWSEVLRVERVGVHDNFFALGGHSLLGMQVNSRMRQAFGVELPLRALFESESLATLAAHVEEQTGLRATETIPVRRVERNGGPPYRLPPSYAQQRLWFIDQYESGEPLYNLGVAFVLRGELNMAALEQGFNDLIARHESLRTRFEASQGEPVQVIEAAAAMTVPVLDLSGAAEREVAVQELIRREMKGKFDLSRGPLFRVWLVKTEEQEHVLLLVLHHIVTDEWSLGLMLRELSELYAAACAGRIAALTELPVQYGDYAMWQREMLQGEVLEEQLAYWRRQLGEGKSGLELPVDHGRPARMSRAGASVKFRFPGELTRAVRELNKREDVTLYMTLLAAWQLLLARYSHSEEVWVGTAVANRGRAEWEHLIGFLVNTVVIRTEVHAGMSVRDLLQQVRERCWESYEHQDAPYELVVEQVQRERDVRRPGLFEVMFSLQQGAAGQLELAGLAVSGVEVETETARYELTLTVSEIEEELVGRLEYRTDLYEAARMERMARHYEQLLAAMAADVEAPVWGLKFLSAAEESEQIEELNRTARAFPRESSIAEQFELQAAQHGEAEAVVYGSERLSYRELNERANQLAHYLRQQGVGPDVVVGVSQERSVDLIVSLLAILKAGGAYLPLDPDYPESRREYMAAQAGASLVLTVFPEDLHTRSTNNLERQSGGDNLAYVMYTSGSTGRPKGVCVTQANVLRLVYDPCYVSVGPGDTVAQASTASFDASTFEIWSALLNGARLVGVTREELLSPAQLGKILTERGVSVVLLITPVMNAVAREAPESLAGIRQILFGADRADARSVATLRAVGVPRLVHLYGPTEVTVCASWHEVKEVASTDVTVPIGRPIDNSEVYVLDDRGLLLPLGVVGELYLGGAGLARGYVNDAAQTAERFVPHPFAKRPGERLYRTGDLGRRRMDGELEFAGRVDEQVKLRGYRIEPGEIEQALREHEAVKDAVAVVRSVLGEEQRLVAYVVADAAAVSVTELRAHLRERLPDYMVPWSYEYLERLPLNANGKVDREALPEPAILAEAGEEYVAPRTPAEEVLCGIWREVLNVERVGINDNFFALGGHSLLATQVAARINEAMNVQLLVRHVFESPTVAEMAQYVESLKQSEDPEQITEVFDLIESLSDEEARALLEQKQLI